MEGRKEEIAKVKKSVEIFPDDPLATLRSCDGFYERTQGADGKWDGPLVAYSSKYQAADGQMRQWVGNVYANFVMVELYPRVLEFFAIMMADRLNNKLSRLGPLDYDENILCGVPYGGYDLATAIGMVTHIRKIKASKKTIVYTAPTPREEFRLIFDRHQIEPGHRYIIVKDVCRNFSTAEELITLIGSAGGIVSAIICFLNRSLTVSEDYYSATTKCNIPVISLLSIPLDQWKQDDPAVAEDVRRNNVVWDPKRNWARLISTMPKPEPRVVPRFYRQDGTPIFD